jgi:hypothetical protein
MKPRRDSNVLHIKGLYSGLLHLPPSWGDADSPVTDGFERWFTQVARGMGDIRKAARLAGLDPALGRRALRRSHERLSDLAAAWLPSHSRIEGLFERKAVRVHDGLKELVQEYLALEQRLKKKHDPKLVAALFFRGLILCENEESLRFVKTIDLIEVRRRMKEGNPYLFAELLESLQAATKGS